MGIRMGNPTHYPLLPCLPNRHDLKVSTSTSPTSTSNAKPAPSSPSMPEPDGPNLSSLLLPQGNVTRGGGNVTLPDEPMITTSSPGRLTWISPVIRGAYKPKFKTDEVIKFRWKYDDNVQVQPKNLTLATSLNLRDWTNITHLSGGAMSYDWDLRQWDATTYGPLVADKVRTIALYDERGIGAHPEAGRLSASLDLSILLYQSNST